MFPQNPLRQPQTKHPSLTRLLLSDRCKLTSVCLTNQVEEEDYSEHEDIDDDFEDTASESNLPLPEAETTISAKVAAPASIVATIPSVTTSSATRGTLPTSN